jgi:hypothetical protein
VAEAQGQDAAILQAVREDALAALAERGLIQAWTINDTGLPIKSIKPRSKLPSTYPLAIRA